MFQECFAFLFRFATQPARRLLKGTVGYFLEEYHHFQFREEKQVEEKQRHVLD